MTSRKYQFQPKLNTTWCLFCIVSVVIGCGDPSLPSPKTNVHNWRASSIGGPIEARSLPAAEQVVDEYDRWLDSEAVPKARVYEIILCGASNQLTFTTEVRREKTPLGQAEHTYVCFIYKDPIKGA